jgi:glycosyltransferase involved in cell wall biosynthesis
MEIIPAPVSAPVHLCRAGSGYPHVMINDTYIVVPAYNEGKIIRSTVRDLQQSFTNIVVVNDGSTDDTLDVLHDLGVTTITHLINIGQGAALQTGISHALRRGANAIVSFDADGQHQISDVIEMLKVLEQGDCDVVLGSRFLGSTRGISAGRKLLLRAAVIFSNLTTRVKLTDAHNGLRVMNRRAAACLDITQFGMAHATEIIQQFQAAGMRIREHPVTIHYTDYSRAKGQRSLNAINVLLDLLIGRFFK